MKSAKVCPQSIRLQQDLSKVDSMIAILGYVKPVTRGKHEIEAVIQSWILECCMINDQQKSTVHVQYRKARGKSECIGLLAIKD